MLRRPPGEIACDVFAAELLLPYKLFKPRVDAADMGFAAIGDLADEFDASLISTASRFATFSASCAPSSSPRAAKSVIARARHASRRQGLDQAGSAFAATHTAPAYGPARPRRAPRKPSPTSGSRIGTGRCALRGRSPPRPVGSDADLLWFDDDDLPPPRAERKRWGESTRDGANSTVFCLGQEV